MAKKKLEQKMIDLRDYKKYTFSKQYGFHNTEAINLRNLSFNDNKGRQLKDIISIIQNLASQNIVYNMYFPDLIFERIIFNNNKVQIKITPIYQNGKTNAQLFFYTIQRLNETNFPFSITIKNPLRANIEMWIEYSAQQRIIDSTKYSKTNFSQKINSYQTAYGITNSLWQKFLQQTKMFLSEKMYPDLILFYLPNNSVNSLKTPTGAKIAGTTLTDILHNPFGSLKKPLLYAGGAFLVYTVVKEAAKKHL